MKRVLASVCLALIATSAMAAKTKTTTKTAASTKAIWTTTGKVVSVEGNGLSAATIKTIKATKIASKVCASRTPTDADVQAAISGAIGSCTFSKFGMATSTIRAVMTCTGAYGPMQSDFIGSRGTTSYTGSNTAVFPGSSGDVIVRSVLSGKITGSC